MKYQFAFHRQYRIGWRVFEVVGHRFEKDLDKMVLYFEDGGIREIAKWSNCECRLKTDWALAMKKAMEKESGAKIP
jgi:hypothetical protein